MAFRAICVALLLSSLPIAGCGTAANLVSPGPEEGGKIPFGGVKRDMTCIEQARNEDSCCTTLPKAESGQQKPAAPLLLAGADLPFSFIGDVLTWPYTAAYTWINQPVPVPPITPAAVEAPPQINPGPELQDPDKKMSDKDGDKGKQKDDKPDPVPVPLPKDPTP